MIKRCHNPKATDYHRYGAKGITVCDRWRHGENGLGGFQCFIADMGDKPSPEFSIERKDNSRGYEPSNCVWSAKTQQTRNRSITRIVEWKGEKIALTLLCERMKLDRDMVFHRLDAYGWSLEKALTTPAMNKRACAAVRWSSST